MPLTSRPHATVRAFAAAFGSGPVRVGDALAAGLTRSQLRAAVGRGLLVSPRHGLLAIPDDAATAPSWAQQMVWEHMAEVRAAETAVGPGAIATHDSAAIALGLARPTAAPPERVTLARRGVQDFDGPRLRVRGSEIPSAFVVRVDDVLVTDVRRTAVDLARSRSLPGALVPIDAAARALVAQWSGAVGNDLRHAVREPALRRRRGRSRTTPYPRVAGGGASPPRGAPSPAWTRRRSRRSSRAAAAGSSRPGSSASRSASRSPSAAAPTGRTSVRRRIA